VFGAPLRLAGTDYEALAKQVESAVRTLLPERRPDTSADVEAA
jgi:hypothetical protein